MFEKLLHELKESKRTEVSVPLEADTDGYYDKECPGANCLFGFKIFADDWHNLVHSEEMFCPSCRHAAPTTSWFTTDQIKQARKHALDELKGRINNAMRADVQAWNRRQRSDSFLKITMKVTGGRATSVLLPIAAAEPMRLRTTCDTCNCRYSYIGAAFFCPACGSNSVSHTFSQTLDTIRASVRNGPLLREVLDKDEAEVLIRTLLEKGFQDAVMCFQRLNEQLRDQMSDPAPTRRNLFQSLDEGSQFWVKAVGQDFEMMIGSDRLSRLRRYFQQRHLLAHRQGIVDEDYIVRSEDTDYVLGQRLVLREADAMDMVELVNALGDALTKIVRT